MPSTLIGSFTLVISRLCFLIVMRTTPIKPIGVFFVLIGLGPEHLSYGTCEVRNCVLKIFCGVRNISNHRLKKNIAIPCLLLLISLLIIITLILFDGSSQRYVKGELGSPLFDPLFKWKERSSWSLFICAAWYFSIKWYIYLYLFDEWFPNLNFPVV